MRQILAYGSLAMCLGLFAIYSLRPDWATALTIFPAWIWLAAWLLALPALRLRVFRYVTIAWLLFGLVQVEEYHSLLRSLRPAAEVDGSLRVTTINSFGSIESVRDALLEIPDVLLIQESPTREALSELLETYPSYALLFGMDTSILVRGAISPMSLAVSYTVGAAQIDGRDYGIVSLRLLTTDPRIDLWNGHCWTAQRQRRVRQMEQLSEIVRHLPEGMPLIVGGDFNAPQRDRIYSLMDGRLSDSYRTGGRGWCNTVLVEYPMLRIDQVWSSSELICYDASVRSSPQTDHLLYTARFLVALESSSGL